MSKKKKSKYAKFVNHPRYGDKPRYTNDKHSMTEILKSYWGYKEDEVILSTCIEANLEKQNYTVFPRSIYVDLMRNCASCRRKFIFYAKEQQYWYEELRFFIDCDCVKCVDCRKKEQKLKQLIKKYHLLHTSKRTVEEQAIYRNIALELYQLGYIKNKQKLPKS